MRDPSDTGGSTRLRSFLPFLLFAGGILAGGLLWTLWHGRSPTPPPGGNGTETGVVADSVREAAENDSGAITPPGRGPSGAAGIGEQRSNAIVAAAGAVGPGVVSISVVQTRYVRGRAASDPFGFFFDRYLPGPIYRERVPGLGSGFIIDRNGIVLTNEHVVREAEQIKVTLTDGRTFDARVIGSDPNYDLAVLRISGESLPVCPLGDSDEIVVGEWAIAIGNPFGFLLNDYQPTVTAGVISAKNRDIAPSSGTEGIYKNMIQTDAAINPGNSGGPLVNGEGKVIGINTFIFTESGGSLGIGFAIPINVAERVVREILQYGEVRRIWIGLTVMEVTPYLAAYFNLREGHGLFVREIENDSPADRAGIVVGDLILAVNGESVSRLSQAQRLIFGAAVGDRITLSVERAGSRRDVQIRLEAVPSRGARPG
ncbi:MAG: trypsin-like serine protease [Candidatus Eisenbacteria bacterium]|nr:trypsin-like serine protease [Candidatus Eisenbacteria bacterium]